MDPVTTIRQQFYPDWVLSPITLEHVHLTSLAPKSISDLMATLEGKKRLGVAASYGVKCFPDALAFVTKTRVLLITMDIASRSAKES